MRQYIGARYVPKFMGTYDATQDYEALCVVDNGQGTSYISKIPTPAGTPLTNGTYWAIYGASGGAVINLQNQIDVINDDITDTNYKVSNIKKGGDIILLSASYGETPSLSDNCLVYLETLLAHVCDHIYTKAHSGYAFNDGTMLLLLQELENDVENPENVLNIIVIGYGNDATATEASVLSGMQSFSAYCHTQYPNAKLSLAPVSIEGSSAGAIARLNCYKQMQSHEIEHEISMMTGLFKILATNYPKYAGADIWHPSTEGAKLIARGVFNYLVNGSFNTYEMYNDAPASNKTMGPDIGTPSGFFQDIVEIDNEKIQLCGSVNFLAIQDINVSISWGVTKIMSCNPLIRGCDTDNYRALRSVFGILHDNTDHTDKQVRIIPMADSNGDYYYYMTSTGEDFTMTNGHNYSLKFFGTIPFEFN